MTTTLEIRFLSGRAHGTPWGTSHNEGITEFPPSPWRLLRALVATWFERAPQIPETTVRSLIQSLASTTPSYRVPPFNGAHVRHYLPESAHRKGVETSTAKVIDAFVAIDRDTPLIVRWPIELATEEKAALDSLVKLLPYVGRAEALTCARVVDAIADDSTTRWISEGTNPGNAAAPLRLLCPSDQFSWDALLSVPWKLRQQGFVLPHGAVHRTFIPDGPLDWDRTVVSSPMRPNNVRFLHWNIKGQGKIPASAAVAYCETLRSAVMRAFKDSAIEPGWELTGKDDGIRTTRNHKHAHYLPVIQGQFLTGLTLWVPAGLSHEHAQIAASPRNLHNRERDGLRDFRDVSLFLQHSGPKPGGSSELGAPAAVWQTVTPYAPPRYVRSDSRMMRSLHQQIMRDLAEVGYPEPVRTEIVSGSIHPLEFRRHRLQERLRDGRTAYHVRLHFAVEISGPVSLGALSHFGLGHFNRVGSADPDDSDVIARYEPSIPAS